MINIRMMYSKEIPVQVEFTQDKLKKTVQLDEKFQISVDSIAMKDGSYGSDDYLDSWEWVKMDPVNNELNDDFVQEYISKYVFPKDFIKKLSSSIDDGTRKGTPGSIDDWIISK